MTGELLSKSSDYYSMDVFRYNAYNIKKLETRDYLPVVKFKGSPFKGKRIAFISTDIYSNAISASQYLSLTYLPRHCYTVDINGLTLENNEGQPINISKPTSVTRAWPAFGKFGGGHEILVVSKSRDKIIISKHNSYLDGGLFDVFHQDSVMPLAKTAIRLLVSGVASSLAEPLPTLTETGRFMIKNGFPVFKYRLGDDLYSISVGIKETPDGMILHIWGYKWRDQDSWRYILCSVEDEFQALSVGNEELREYFRSKSSPLKSEFEARIRNLATFLQKDQECSYATGYRRIPCCGIRLPN